MTRDELRNALADLAHRVWAEWWEYQRSCCESLEPPLKSGETAIVIPPKKLSRWDRQARTNMIDLPPGEDKSDFEIADRYLELVDAYLMGYFYGRDVLTDGENPDDTSQR